MGKSARFGWNFVSVALHTLNQVSMSLSVVFVSLEVLVGGDWRFYVGEGETGVTNLLVCTVSLMMCVTRYRWSTCACAGCVVCCDVVLHCR